MRLPQTTNLCVRSADAVPQRLGCSLADCSHCGCLGCDCPGCAKSNPGKAAACRFCGSQFGQPWSELQASYRPRVLQVLELPSHSPARAPLHPSPGHTGRAQALLEVQAKLRRFWPRLQAAMACLVVRPLEVSFKGTGTQTKHRAWMRPLAADGGKLVAMSQPYASAEAAAGEWSMEPYTVVDLEGGEGAYTAHSGGELRVSQIAELLERLAEAPLSEWQKRCLATVGTRTSSPPCGEWLDALLGPSGPVQLVDSFTHLHPHAQARFTCWDQYKNRRYENQGTRIDGIYLDSPLAGCLVPCACCCDQPPAALPVNHTASPAGPRCLVAPAGMQAIASEAAAFSATVAHGRWKPAPFDGTGIVEGTTAVRWWCGYRQRWGDRQAGVL